MPKPPSSPATPRPAPELLARLTTLAQELAGAFRPATVIEAVARALAELLKPDRLSVILLDAESNRLAVTYDTHPVPARTDDPLLQLALRRGPLAFPKDVREEARRRGSALPDDAASPGSWLGAPLVAGGRTMGAVSLSSERSGMLGKAELTLVSAVLAQAAIALENARDRSTDRGCGARPEQSLGLRRGLQRLPRRGGRRPALAPGAASGNPPGGRAGRDDRQEPALLRAQPGGGAHPTGRSGAPGLDSRSAAQSADGAQGRGHRGGRARAPRRRSEREPDQAGIRERDQQRVPSDRQ